MESFDWLGLIEVIILCLTALFGIPQIYFLRKQIKEQHEEQRRINTVNYMITWCNSVEQDTAVAEQVGRYLSTKQCKKLYKLEPFDISEDIKKEVCKFCTHNGAECEKCKVKSDKIVEGQILSELRWHIITYLNTLETVILAWQLGIVDEKIVEEQFAFINDTDKGQTLSVFRSVAGGYPAIEHFIDKIKEKGEQPRPKL